MSVNQELVVPVTDAGDSNANKEAEDADAYYERLMSQVTATLEESKVERERRSTTEVEAHATPEGYIVEFFINGVSPLQAMAYLSDPDNMRYYNPRITEARAVREERDATGVDYLELKLKIRRLVMCCIPVTSNVQVKYCLEKDKDELVCYEKQGWTEKTHTYTFEEENKGTRIMDVVQMRMSRCSRLCSSSSSPLSSQEHIRALQRLKRILEATDDPLLMDDDPSAKLLFTDL